MGKPLARRARLALAAVALLSTILLNPALARADGPQISSFSPPQGPVGTPVTVLGTGFSNANRMSVGGVDAAFTIGADSHITLQVPAGASSGPIGLHAPDGDTTSASSFDVVPSPVIQSLSPSQAPVGAPIVLSGTGFTGATSVRFNGVVATFTVNSDTQISTSVPSTASSGPVDVTTPGGTATSASAFTVQPNIVLIATDDQRFDELSMPTVQSELIGKGVSFSNGFVVNSMGSPSRVTLLTGKYSHSTGIYDNSKSATAFRDNGGDKSTLATWLRDAGYKTALVGKYMTGYKDLTYVPPGWTTWDVFQNPDYYNYTLSLNGVSRAFPQSTANYSTDVLSSYATTFVRGVPSTQPLFLYFAPNAPHTPPVEPPRYSTSFPTLAPLRRPDFNEADVSDKPAYVRATSLIGRAGQTSIDSTRKGQFQTLLGVDDAVRSILQALIDTGRLSNTLIIFTSDNGFLLGEHRFKGKQAPYEESIRVPFVVRYDPMTQGIARTDIREALNLDVAPTLADAAGVRAPGADGSSMLPLLSGASTTWRSDFLIEHGDYTTDTLKTPIYCGLRTDRYAYVKYKTGEEELYDLQADPYELQNQASNPAFASLKASLRTRFLQLCSPPPPGFTP
ncbi:MAG: sulfatase-like hydrolase/transferase [Actinomycetota bacterium]